MKISKRISTPLLKWFEQYGRKDLPWQRNTTPYRVWISEIMLQQTQVATVIPYYKNFMKSFPNVKALATAPLDKVLHHWSGLGYYARARNLHKAANIIYHDYAGRFPREFNQVLALPGIGESTAGAILSLALGQRHAILDGNVKRVLTRYLALPGWPGDKRVADKLWQWAKHFTPQEDHVAQYNQAIMDLGATVCHRGTPLCEQCPLRRNCCAFQRNEQKTYPQGKNSRPLPVKEVQLLMIRNTSGKILLHRRPPSGIWGGLWSLPECPLEVKSQQWCRDNLSLLVNPIRTLSPIRHRFSHYELVMHPRELSVHSIPEGVMETQARIWYPNGDELGLASPIKNLLEQYSPEGETL